MLSATGKVLLFIVSLRHEVENKDIKQRHNFLKRKVYALIRYETIKPEMVGYLWKTEISAGK